MAADKGQKAMSGPIDDEVPAGHDMPEEDHPMTFWEHLEELRKRIIYSVVTIIVAFFVAWEFRDPALDVLTKPFMDAWREQKIEGAGALHYSAPGAGFSANVHVALLLGLAGSAPVIFYQLWAFIAPGLYAKEKRFVIPFVFFSTLLFVGGGYFGWLAAFPIAFNYFLGFSGPIGGHGLQVTPTIMLDSYLDFVVQMLLAFGIIFELPLLILFLSIAGIVNYLQLLRFGRWFILIAVIMAGVLTPPDVTSQLIMAIPLITLYFLSIGLAAIFGKKPTDRQKKEFWEAVGRKKNKPLEEA